MARRHKPARVIMQEITQLKHKKAVMFQLQSYLSSEFIDRDSGEAPKEIRSVEIGAAPQEVLIQVRRELAAIEEDINTDLEGLEDA